MADSMNLLCSIGKVKFHNLVELIIKISFVGTISAQLSTFCHPAIRFCRIRCSRLVQLFLSSLEGWR